MTSSDEAVTVLRPDGTDRGRRRIAVEAPVAIEVDGLGYAVMMMTPADLEVFAVGFMLTERLADTAADVVAVDPFEVPEDIGAGWIVRVLLSDRCRPRIHDRVRHRTSDTSCGLCGIAGLEQLRRPAPHALAPCVDSDAVFTALSALRDRQPLHVATGAAHAAAACAPDGAIGRVHEDVGRHNALDKLVGALALADETANGFVLVTSRISFEMVDKTLVSRAPMLVGVSAPTTLATEHARAHGLTLLALARRDAILVMNDPYGLFPERAYAMQEADSA